MQSFLRKIQIDIPTQRLHLWERPDSPAGNGEPEPWKLVESFPISSSAFGLGTEPGSLRTPLGRFGIAEKFGENEPLGAVFKARVPTGEIAPLETPAADDDLITTRILWLTGLDDHNANTRERYIYIHGTNHEERIGEPASHGCIRMKNADIARLYDIVAPGTEVVIESPLPDDRSGHASIA